MSGFSRKPNFDLAASHPRPTLRPAASAHSGMPETAGFAPVNDLLEEMGLAPLTQSGTAAKAPLVAPHPQSRAEFSPPRPLRRQPTRFALSPPDEAS